MIGKLTTVEGDVTNPQRTVPNEIVLIPHCCNNLKIMGAGVAKSLKNKWPEVYEVYQKTAMCLGEVSFVAVGDGEDIKTIVANMIGQDGIVSLGNSKPVKYWALAKAMVEITDYIYNHFQEDKVVIHTPKFGSELAQGNFEFILELIREIWLEQGIDVKVYEFVPPNTDNTDIFATF